MDYSLVLRVLLEIGEIYVSRIPWAIILLSLSFFALWTISSRVFPSKYFANSSVSIGSPLHFKSGALNRFFSCYFV
jgi:hypothetical protein